jgi:hypothetical protein
MTYTNNKYNSQKYLIFRKKEISNISLILKGQGVFIFGTANPTSISSIRIYNEDDTKGLKIKIIEGAIIVKELPNKNVLEDKNNTEGICNKEGAYYWISIDSHNQLLQVGVGEARIETAIYTYQFPSPYKNFLENLTKIFINEENPDIQPMRLLRDPITNSVPLIIKDTHKLTMHQIAKSSYLPKANLSLVAQKLHDCISGKRFILDDKDFPDFSKAIERSIVTPGLWCYKRLQEKASEFGKPNIKETYLRITLGLNNGESPGIPYVMEIWPIGHYSPVHNHGGASAIIRVLHGKINVKLFPFLSKDVKEFNEAVFKKGDITWISPTLNQVHQLHNLDMNTKTCITIQCYMYENDDITHYDYFDYIDDEKGNIEQYEPDSDMDFISFKHLMKEEWKTRPSFYTRMLQKMKPQNVPKLNPPFTQS